jgi:hypothetical protein
MKYAPLIDVESKAIRTSIETINAPAGSGLFQDEIDKIVPIVKTLLTQANTLHTQKVEEAVRQEVCCCGECYDSEQAEPLPDGHPYEDALAGTLVSEQITNGTYPTKTALTPNTKI